MSPVFRTDPTKVAAGIPVYPKGSYEIELGDPKPFLRTTASGKNAGQENHGVMFRCIIVEGPQKGKAYIHNCMMHTPESEGFSKQFQMAAYGYERKDEAKFDEEIGSTKDWIYDPKPEDGSDPTCGDGWRDMKGKRIKIDLGVKQGTNGETQSVEGIRPV
jgi:hypothetical protein